MRRISIVVGVLLVVLVGALPSQAASQNKDRQANKVTASAPVNLNTATAVQLESLPGIGPRTAERILEYREKSGGFKKIEELMNVQGVGEKNFLKIKDLISVTPPKGKDAGPASKR